MQRKEFENRIKSLLPKAADDVVESWAEYATELDQDGTGALMVLPMGLYLIFTKNICIYW